MALPQAGDYRPKSGSHNLNSKDYAVLTAAYGTLWEPCALLEAGEEPLCL